MFKQTLMLSMFLLVSICMVSSVLAADPELFLEGNVLAAGNYNAGAGSSDITLIVRVEAGGEVVVDEGMVVGYVVPQEDIDDWIEPDFDDSDWNRGVSGVGYGDGDDNTGVRSGNVLSVYTRYYFDVPDARNIDTITVSVDYDDGYILWLNGEHIGGTVNAPGGEAPPWNINGGGHEATGLDKGKPNQARWDAAGIDKFDVPVDFGGQMPEGSAGKPPEGSPASLVSIYKEGNVIAGANFNDGPGSSDMTLILRLLGDDEIYVDEGYEVKYIHNPDNSDVDDSWIQIDYDESGWADGISGVGFSDGDDNTETPPGLISIWTRYQFDVPEADRIKELVLLVDYDDAYIVWLNGVEVSFGGGPPAGNPPAWDSAQGGVGGHGATELPAGKPNDMRWELSDINETIIPFRYAGSSAMAVTPKSKLTTTWGNVKKRN
jgi:hypothetical protein